MVTCMWYTKTQLRKLRTTARNAFTRIANAVDHDLTLSKADQIGLGDYISRAQGALLDLEDKVQQLETDLFNSLVEKSDIK